jgi:hypothetical protein
MIMTANTLTQCVTLTSSGCTLTDETAAEDINAFPHNLTKSTSDSRYHNTRFIQVAWQIIGGITNTPAPAQPASMTNCTNGHAQVKNLPVIAGAS